MKYLILITSFFLCGCLTEKQVTRKATKLMLNNPEATIKVFRKLNPCVSTPNSKGENILKGRLDTLEAMNQYYEELLNNMSYDTVKIIEFDTIHTSDSVNQKAIFEKLNYLKTNLEKSKESNLLLREQISKLFEYIKKTPVIRDTVLDESYKPIIEDLRNQVSEKSDKIEKRGNLNLYLLIALAVSVIINILQIKFKK